MPKLIEVIDSLNNENAEELKETLKSEVIAQQENASRLYVRAKKAEGFEKDKDGNWVKKEKPEAKAPENQEKKSQPSEIDYAKIAFLEQRGVKNKEDQDMVQEEANRLKMPLTDILSMEHIKAKLKANKDKREAMEGMPKGRGSSGSANKNDVDYWLAKGETPDDLELAEKVINARIKKEEQSNKFSNELYS